MVPPARSTAADETFAQCTTRPASRRMLAGPECALTEAKWPKYFAVYLSAPNPPIEKPATARPANSAYVRKLASTHGTSWFRWKFSQLRGPVLLLTGFEYQPALPPSGITTITGLPAVQSRMPRLS